MRYICFMLLSWFLLYNEVNQLCVCIYPLPPVLPPTPDLQPAAPVITEHPAELPVLSSCFPLTKQGEKKILRMGKKMCK